MTIDLWRVSDIKPYAGNPRVNDGAVDAVAASIHEFGFRQPIMVDADVVCGHTRWKTAQKLGLEKAPVHIAKPPVFCRFIARISGPQRLLFSRPHGTCVTVRGHEESFSTSAQILRLHNTA